MRDETFIDFDLPVPTEERGQTGLHNPWGTELMMPKKSEALLSTDREVASAMRPPAGRLVAEYRVAGTPNLVLRVTASRHRAWCYWLKRPKTGRWSKYNIGPTPLLNSL